MNCVASSSASFIAGLVVGFLAVVVLSTGAMFAAYKLFKTEEVKRLRKVAKAALELYDDERVAGCAAEDTPDELLGTAPTVEYAVPADAWEKFERVVGEIFTEAKEGDNE